MGLRGYVEMEITFCKKCLKKYIKYLGDREKGPRKRFRPIDVSKVDLCDKCYGKLEAWNYFSVRDCFEDCRCCEPVHVYFDRIVGYCFVEDWK